MEREYNRIEKRIMLDMMASKEPEEEGDFPHLGPFWPYKSKEEMECYKGKELEDQLKEANHNLEIADTWSDLQNKTAEDMLAHDERTLDESSLSYAELTRKMSQNRAIQEKALEEDALRVVLDNLEQPEFHGNFSDMSEEEKDAIINPKHYKMVPPEAYSKHPEGLEYIDLMEYLLGSHTGVQAHLLGQIYKYACRLGKKDSKLQDANKIKWYADRLVKEIEGV